MSWLFTCIDMGKLRPGLTLLLFFVGQMLSLPTFAGAKETVESLLKPGGLSKAHARYEKECDKCHENFKADRQNKLCLECHKGINENIVKKTGSHGRIKDIKERECRTCHAEHKGRDRNLSAFDHESFDHAHTDFVLKGWHLQVECAQCHKPNSKFSDAKKDCIACHRKDDRHKTRLGALCKNCHVEAAWKTARFDHDKTSFKLKERHKDVVCADCHPNERYANTPANCYFCHEMDDTHVGNHGKKCDACHVESGWFKVKFNHDKDTKFELKDVHGKLACKDCHGGNVYEKPLKADCYSCHEAGDKHKGQYGKDCQKCHTVQGWAPTRFEHNEDTDFQLRGDHKKIVCEDCHRGPLFEEKIGTACFSCHRFDDVHRSQEGKTCERCHDERGWETKVVFDHGISKFPLHGAHVLVTCEECHASNSYKDAEVKCVACHKKDDIHKERLGAKCDLCHGPYDWLAWQFDHDLQADFPLDGKHEGIDCHACHKDRIKDRIELSLMCHSCHKSDDVHNGSLGPQCDKCHVTSSFKKKKLK